MNKKQSIVLSIGVILLLIIAIVLGIRSRNNSQAGSTLTPVPTNEKGMIGEKNGDTDSQNDSGNSGGTQTPRSTVAPTTRETNIKVFSPKSGQKVGSTFDVTGEARVFENTFQVKVTNGRTHEEIFNQTAMADAPDIGMFGSYSVPVDLSSAQVEQGDPLILDVFQYSAKDGSEIDKVTVSLVY